MATVGFKGLIS